MHINTDKAGELRNGTYRGMRGDRTRGWMVGAAVWRSSACRWCLHGGGSTVEEGRSGEGGHVVSRPWDALLGQGLAWVVLLLRGLEETQAVLEVVVAMALESLPAAFSRLVVFGVFSLFGEGPVGRVALRVCDLVGLGRKGTTSWARTGSLRWALL